MLASFVCGLETPWWLLWGAFSRDPIKSTEEPVTVRLVPPLPSIGCLGACKLHRLHPVDSRLLLLLCSLCVAARGRGNA